MSVIFFLSGFRGIFVLQTRALQKVPSLTMLWNFFRWILVTAILQINSYRISWIYHHYQSDALPFSSYLHECTAKRIGRRLLLRSQIFNSCFWKYMSYFIPVNGNVCQDTYILFEIKKVMEYAKGIWKLFCKKKKCSTHWITKIIKSWKFTQIPPFFKACVCRRQKIEFLWKVMSKLTDKIMSTVRLLVCLGIKFCSKRNKTLNWDVRNTFVYYAWLCVVWFADLVVLKLHYVHRFNL